MDQRLVKLLTFLVDGHHTARIEAAYADLAPAEKDWVDARLDDSPEKARDEYMATYTPERPKHELFVWLDRFLRANTFQHLAYDTEYLRWNITRCRESMSAEDTAWIDTRFSVDTLVRREVYSKEDVYAMYLAWTNLE